MKITFCSIYSGSSGNSQFINYKGTNILIDAGLSGKKIQEGLEKINVKADMIDGIFITHEHTDHIQGAGVLSRRFDIPIFATEKTWGEIKKTSGNIKDHNIKIVSVDNKISFKDLEIDAFNISHDAVEPVGYNVSAGRRKISILTDTGCINDNIKSKIKDFDVLLLETNHDVELLKVGSYPIYLKKRILSDIGHLSNETAGLFLCEIIKKGNEVVYLGHLSRENNFPELAFETVNNILAERKIFTDSNIVINMTYRDRPSYVCEL